MTHDRVRRDRLSIILLIGLPVLTESVLSRLYTAAISDG